MKFKAPITQSLPLAVVGSTKFGRYPKISTEQTYNMIVSDDWLVPYAGYLKTNTIESIGSGRGIFASIKYNHLIVVIDDAVYSVTPNLSVDRIAKIETFTGDVYIKENNANQIAICDKKNIYIFNYVANTFGKATLDFVPDHLTFQNGYFIAAIQGQAKWRLSALNNGLSWPAAGANVGELQTKADKCVACARFPGRGNQLLVFGNTVTEFWTDVGTTLFPYQRSSSINIDYGCVSASTIATGDKFVIWLGINEKSGAAIMYTTGGDVEQISTDGINFKLAQLKHPEKSYAFLFKQDGHLFYQLTFSDPEDNYTLTYDFNTGLFFTLCDKNMNHHIAKRVSYFNNKYYFVSFLDGNLYELSSNYSTNDTDEIVRIRICPNVRLPDSSPFIINSITFPIEQGEAESVQRVDLSVSRDGGVSFGNIYGQTLNSKGNRKNRLIFWNLGLANDFVPQFRFWGFERFIATNGLINIYQ